VTGKVSVVLPTHNRAHTLLRAIESVLRQTHADLELIVVDDGSTDGTPPLVAGVADPRVRYLRMEKNCGAHAARNFGIRAATGRYVSFQDSDDVWLPEKLERHLKVLAECPGAGVSVVGAVRISRDGRRYPIPKLGRRPGYGCHNLTAPLLAGNFIGTPMLLVERQLLIDVGSFDEGRTHLMEDWDLALRLSMRSRFAYCDRILHIAHDGGDNIFNAQAAELAAAISSIVAKHGALFMRHKTELAMQYLLLARHYLQCGDNTRAWRCVGRVLRLDRLIPVHIFAAIIRLSGRAIAGLIPARRANIGAPDL
jgi:glycosyltransferase involved in cell wall biosynthesis